MTPEPTIPPRPEGIAGKVWDLTFGAGLKTSKILEAGAAIEDIKDSVSKDAVYLIQFMDDFNKLTVILEKVNANLELMNEHMTALIPEKKEE